MKRILITGANSYIGTSFEKYIKKSFSDCYEIDTVSMVDGSWRGKNFSGYDVVFHTAGIAHQKETKKNAHLYYEVNRDLAIEVANKAKIEGVRQFIFLSTMSVYGKDTGIITKETKPSPKTNYGISKLEAEQQICSMGNYCFKTCVLRPPMVYGDGCKGNYQTIVKIVNRFPLFPKVNNKKSLISIDNLCIFVKRIIDLEVDGLFFPQDDEYICTSNLALRIANQNNKKIYLSRVLGFIVLILRPFSKRLKKAFGSLIYTKD